MKSNAWPGVLKRDFLDVVSLRKERFDPEEYIRRTRARMCIP